MNKTPYTPFSTPLSGSAKETEKRFQSILKWKKARPPRFLLILVLCISILCCSLVACRNGKQEEHPEQAPKYKNLTIDEIPPVEEMREMSAGDRIAVRQAMDRIPASDYQALMERAITAYCESDAVPDRVESVALVGVTVEQDRLFLISGQNHKSLDNLMMQIELSMEAADPLEYSAIASENETALLQYLSDGYYAFDKTREFTIHTTSQSGHTAIRTSDPSGRPEIAFREQPEAEYALQTLAFQFAEKNDDYVLQKFGILPETGELYIEYYADIDDLFGGTSSYPEREKALEAYTAKLPEVCEEIEEMVMSGEEARTYIEETGLTSYTIAFRSGNWDGEYQIFHRPIPVS